jgi:hypothetical protein
MSLCRKGSSRLFKRSGAARVSPLSRVMMMTRAPAEDEEDGDEKTAMNNRRGLEGRAI